MNAKSQQALYSFVKHQDFAILQMQAYKIRHGLWGMGQMMFGTSMNRNCLWVD